MIKNNVNTLRGWAILGVIAIHVSMNFTKFTELSWLPVSLAAIDIYAHFAVPLFVVISGFLLAAKYDRDYSIGDFYKKRLNRILFPFLIWSVLYMLLNPENLKDPFQAVFDVFTGGSYYHLWFFFLIIQLYLLFPFLRKLLKNKNFLIILIMLFVQVLFRHLREDMAGSDNFTTLIKGLFFSYIFYFSIGIWIADNIESTERFLSRVSSLINSVIFASTVLFSFIFSYNWLSEYNGFFERISLFALLEKIILPFVFIMIFINLNDVNVRISGTKLQTALNILSKYSFGIYLSHALILRIAVLTLKQAGITWENAAFYPASFFLTLFASIVFCYLTERTPLSKPLLGIERKSNIT
jgi:surface polysaccharide O-acyltransferase-like enzyme